MEIGAWLIFNHGLYFCIFREDGVKKVSLDFQSACSKNKKIAEYFIYNTVHNDTIVCWITIWCLHYVLSLS